MSQSQSLWSLLHQCQVHGLHEVVECWQADRPLPAGNKTFRGGKECWAVGVRLYWLQKAVESIPCPVEPKTNKVDTYYYLVMTTTSLEQGHVAQYQDNVTEWNIRS